MNKKTTSRPYNLWLPYRLWLISEAVQDELEVYLREHFGLTRANWRIISTLSFNKLMSATQLAVWTNLDQTRVSQCMAQLAKEGLITRTINVTDRRKIRIRNTLKGDRLVARVMSKAIELEDELLSQLTEKEQTGLITALRKLEHFTLTRAGVDPPE